MTAQADDRLGRFASMTYAARQWQDLSSRLSTTVNTIDAMMLNAHPENLNLIAIALLAERSFPLRQSACPSG
jgi:hypothetical protein